jgi:hypothetical protein
MYGTGGRKNLLRGGNTAVVCSRTAEVGKADAKTGSGSHSQGKAPGSTVEVYTKFRPEASQGFQRGRENFVYIGVTGKHGREPLVHNNADPEIGTGGAKNI